ncbi:MAG: TIGR00282 family metallophosphoesterase [Candidatus Omnitrophica bacterium]|nr:TIGR00282 family metallophosphoesterase [Candidatus Omnitrophota bacterium]MBU1038104.1 TIGR00282 family metallophosphoesterase [Candidatus Omnitrophota bacterium]MBU1808216.1 TIGR00282 family metallophosphoesterase [Candidatus Omnitrophota bacterium]
MKILFIGDVVGAPGRSVVEALVPKIKKREGIDFVIVNGENVAAGSGVTPALAGELFGYGADVITSGDHIWKRKEMVVELGSDKRLLRPANYPAGAPGFGYGIFEAGPGRNVGVLNLVGRVFMTAVECPFRTAKEAIDKIKDRSKIIIVDMHAEATSEKIALGYYLDGQVSAVLGTHTHVQTSDEKILPGGTAFISDVGMTGPFDGVIGRKKEQIIRRFLTQLPTKFEMAEGDIQLHGVILDIDDKTGRALSITRVQEKL